MKQALHRLTVATRGKGLVEITREVLAWVADQGIDTGLLTLWCRHTSASLTVQENADPTVREDIARYFETLVPEDARYALGPIVGRGGIGFVHAALDQRLDAEFQTTIFSGRGQAGPGL